MRISDWSSDVCSSDLGNGAGADIGGQRAHRNAKAGKIGDHQTRGERSPGYLLADQPQPVQGALAVPRDDEGPAMIVVRDIGPERAQHIAIGQRSEEHTSELQSLMRNSYAVFCLK